MVKRLGALVLMVMLLMAPGRGASSQDAPDDIPEASAEDIDGRELTETLQTFTIVGVSQGLSGARIDFEGDEDTSDLEIRSVKLPIRREWDRGAFCFVEPNDQRTTDYELQPLAKVRDDDVLCTKPYFELTLSHLEGQQRGQVTDTTTLNLDVTTLSALAGFGLIFDIAEGTTFRPILLGGYSHISNDSIFEGEQAELFNESLEGSVVGGQIDSFLIGGAAEFRHEQLLQNDIELEGRLRYNYLVSDVFDASDDALDETNDFVVITSRLELGIPTGFRLFARDIYALGFGGTNVILDGIVSGFSDGEFIHEVGGGLELRNPLFFKGLRLRGSVLFGEDVSGFRAGFAIKF